MKERVSEVAEVPREVRVNVLRVVKFDIDLVGRIERRNHTIEPNQLCNVEIEWGDDLVEQI